MQEYIVGIDLGGMSAKVALFDAEGKILGKTTVITRASDGFEGTAEKLADAAKAAAEKAGVPFGSVRGSLPPAWSTAKRAWCSNGEITAGSTFPWEKRWKG